MKVVSSLKISWWYCTKVVANLRRGNDDVWAGGRAAGRVAGRGAGQEIPARAPRRLRCRPAPLCTRHGPGNATLRTLFHFAVRLHLHWPARAESQLGDSRRHVAGKILCARSWRYGFHPEQMRDDRIRSGPFWKL